MVCTKKNGTVKKYKLCRKYHSNGKEWDNAIRQTSITNTGSYHSVASNGEKFISVSTSGSYMAISESNDGINWTDKQQVDIQAMLKYSITYGNGIYMLVGNISYIFRAYISTDGYNWTQISQINYASSYSCQLNYVVYANNKFYVYGNDTNYNSYVSISDDNGTSWSTPVNTGATSDTFSICYNGEYFVKIQNNGTIRTSPDGISWTGIGGILNAPNVYCVALHYINNKYIVMFLYGQIFILNDNFSTEYKVDDLFNIRDKLFLSSWNELLYDGDRLIALDRVDGYYSVDSATDKYLLARKKNGTVTRYI